MKRTMFALILAGALLVSGLALAVSGAAPVPAQRGGPAATGVIDLTPFATFAPMTETPGPMATGVIDLTPFATFAPVTEQPASRR